MSIPFTQFLRPNGRPRQVLFDASDDIEEKAQALINKGARFEIEELMTGMVYMDCQIGDELLANQLCANGPPIVDAVRELILTAISKIDRRIT